MFKQDYMMRLISELIRALLKLVCNVDVEEEKEDEFQTIKTGRTLKGLRGLIDSGKINEAENLLYEDLEEGGKENFAVALEFYSYLNEKDDEYLRQCDYSREEIALGIRTAAKQYGCEEIADTFLRLL